MISILGFYRRSNDATEYIHFQDDGKEYLTNGVMIWDQEIKEKIDRLEKTETIDIGRMKGWLHTSRPYSNIAKYYGALTFEEFASISEITLRGIFQRTAVMRKATFP